MNEQLEDAVRTILRGFDEGVFVRNTDRDSDPAWAIKLFPFIHAIGIAQRIVSEPVEAATVEGQ